MNKKIPKILFRSLILIVAITIAGVAVYATFPKHQNNTAAKNPVQSPPLGAYYYPSGEKGVILQSSTLPYATPDRLVGPASADMEIGPIILGMAMRNKEEADNFMALLQNEWVIWGHFRSPGACR